MTFELKTKLNPAVQGPSLHKLERDAYWEWWQMSQAFRLIPKRTVDPFKNEALRAAVMFLATCPIQVALMLHMTLPTVAAEHKEWALLKLVVMTALVWLGQLWLFFLAGSRQVRIAQEVVATVEGLEVRSPFFKRKIYWLEINDIFPVGNIETGYEMFELDCNNGEWFLLSQKLSECDRLVSLIESKLSRTKRPSYQFTSRISDGVIDAANLATWAVLIALAFGPLNSGRIPTLPEFLLIATLSSLALANRWIWAHKIPQLIRYGQSEIYLRTRTNSQLIALDQVKQIKKLGNLLILKTRSNWFLLFLNKTEPMHEKLLECRERLMLEQQRVIT